MRQRVANWRFLQKADVRRRIVDVCIRLDAVLAEANLSAWKLSLIPSELIDEIHAGRQLARVCIDVYSSPMQSADLIKRLEQAGWVLRNVAGSHHVFRHPERGRAGLCIQASGERAPPEFTDKLKFQAALTRLAAKDPGVHRLMTEVAQLLKPSSAFRASTIAERLARAIQADSP
jgi:predicted RNA binding protein YcfA (HicA-like mRNA interferase family)